jgi:hypothetical protein
MSRRVSREPTRLSPIELVAHVLEALEDPSELWKTIYDHHLSSRQRQLLQTCATIPRGLVLKDLFHLTRKWVADAVDRNRTDAEWKSDLRLLDGDFLSLDTWPSTDGALVAFANPSIATYVRFRLGSDAETLLRVLENAVLFEQVEQIWNLVAARLDIETETSFGRDFRSEWLTEQEHEIFGEMPVIPFDDLDNSLLRDAFSEAILRTLNVGHYYWHPSLGVRPSRWNITSSGIDRRLPTIYAMLEALGLTQDEDIADSVVTAFIAHLANGQGSTESVLESIKIINAATTPTSWSRWADEVKSTAERLFVDSLIDGQDYLDAADFLRAVSEGHRISELREGFMEAIHQYPSTEAARHRIRGMMPTGIEWIVSEFRQAADRIGIEAPESLIELAMTLRDMIQFDDYAPSRPSASTRSYSPPRYEKKAYFTSDAAFEAAAILCGMQGI